jgi:hypothetical protein
MPNAAVAARSREITDRALRLLAQGRSVVIRAHPGAGKTGGRGSGTVRMARALAADGRRVALLVAQNDQVVETLRRVLNTWPDLDVYFVPASTAWSAMPDWVRDWRRRPNRLRVVHGRDHHRVALESGAGLFVMTAAKFSFLWPAATTAGARGTTPRTYVDPFDVVIVDEAWMAPAALWINLERLARQVALIGDPGQILPWTATDQWYPGMVGSPVEPLPEVAARVLGDQLVILDLAVSRRLASHTTSLVGRLPAYAATGTQPMFDAAEVPLTLGALPLLGAGVPDTLRRLADRGLALHRLPAGTAPQNDPAVARACAELTVGLLRAGATLGHPDGDRPLGAGDVAVLVAHHDQRAAVRQALTDLDPAVIGVRVETFNVIQGATVPVTILWHPISGRTDVSAFHADVGRLTVGLSRHTHGCVVVSREGIGERLAATPSTDDQEGDAPDRRLDGLLAHRVVWDYLSA